ncbi:hypothetical protein [Desulfovibrio cuneatus]|uniref:hypothetical protein n=1 Tax=Desulfovibrio cuneatus TaxID=159728 RepID=UPI0003FF1B5D|nr:hypothetical protein [Desulfovibrio cuneatus]
MHDKEYLTAAANMVGQQLAEEPSLALPLDPDVADFMGAFTEDALTLADLVDDTLLAMNEQGEVCYGQK